MNWIFLRNYRWLRPLVLGTALLSTIALAEPPEWLKAAARLPTPTLPAAAPAVVLLDEAVRGVDSEGRVVEEHRYVVRILNRSGTGYAVGAVSYLDKQDRIQSTTAWLVRAGKEVRPPEKREWIDVANPAYKAVYDENRVRGVNYADLAFAGDVFGFETRVESRLLFAQLGYEWSNLLPVLNQRYTVRLPIGWTSTPSLAGPQATAVQTVTTGASTTWELRDRPHRASEPAMADAARTDAQLLVNLQPAPGGKGAALPVFRTWADVATWDLRNSQGQCDTDAALAATVRKVVSDCPDALGRIKALSRNVQQLRYVALNKGLGVGMGYRPRKATEVHAKGWGDCKDKANLLGAMLREVGIESMLVSARIGGGREVNPTWPSMHAFNHAILAIRVDDSVQLPSALEVPGVGRLLFFDPTSPDTLLGDLPWPLQGAKVHVLAPGNDALTTLPILPTETHHRVDRRARLSLAADGTVEGECSSGGPGAAGAYLRMKVRSMSAKDLRTDYTDRINGTVRGAVIKDLTPTDDPLTGEYRISYTFTAPRFAQQMAGGLSLVRLDVLSRETVPAFPEKDRWSPVEVQPLLQRDEVVLVLPKGYVVDELPTPAVLQSVFGTYESSYATANGEVTVHRALQLKDAVVPVAEYPALRQFLGDVAKAERAVVVLRNDGATPAKP